MRGTAFAALVAVSALACRTYDSYSPLADQHGLVPATQFARYGRQQAEVVAIGRAMSEWKMTDDEAGVTEQAERAACFARRFAGIATVDTDPLGRRLTVRFNSGWRVGILPIPDGTAPEATPGISPPGPSPCT